MDVRDPDLTPSATTVARGHRRRLAVGAFAVALTLVVGACGGGATQAPGGSGGTGAGASASTAPAGSDAAPSADASGGAGASAGASGGTGAIPAPEGEAALTVWNPFTGPDGNFFNDIVEKFNTENPNIKVTVQTQPGAEYIQRLEAASSANQLPHVIAAGYDALPGLTESGIVVPVDDLATQGGYNAQMFPEAIWNAGQWKDQRVGIPIDTHPMVFFYNKKLFTEAGLDPESPPATKDEFEAAITAIQEKTDADGYQMVASGPGANFLVGIQFATLFYQAGGEWTNADYSQATFNSDAGVQAATYLAHLVKDLGVKKVESDAEINAFQQGNNAMVFSGIWESTRYNDALKDDLGVAPVPNILGEGVWGGSHNLAVTKAAADDPNLKAAAYYFIDWFSRNSLTWGAAGQIPARNDIRSQVEGSTEGLLPIVGQIVPMAERVKFLPSIPGGGDLLFIGQGAGEAATLAINGDDPKAALDKAAEYNTSVLVQNKERYGY